MTERTERLAELLLGERAAAPVTPSAGARERLLDSLAPDRDLDVYVDRLSHFFDLQAPRTREILAAAADTAGGEWESGRVPGSRLLHFEGGPRVSAADSGLVHLAPGTEIRRHVHKGDEWSFVLRGVAEEDSGRVFLPGDIVHKPPGSKHSFRVSSDEPFIFALVLYEGIARAAD